MPHISKYWLFQIIGWSCFAFINIYIAILTEELSKEVLVMNFLVSGIGITLSHFYRNYIIRFQLTHLKTEKLLVTVLMAITILSILYNIIYYACLYLMYDNSVFKLKTSTFLGSFVSVFFLFSVWSILYFAWTYIERNRRNFIQQLKMESSMKDLELKTIRSNLQPHFIFNSLNSIRALIDENPEQARKAITRISNILRNSITKQESTDTLENELTLVDDYLSLEKIRFEERLSFSKEIDPASQQIQVPTMMLQTLVENAIKHGISKLEQGGHIHIKTTYQNELLQIEVSNSGYLDVTEQQENSLGFGLNSTRQRLKLLYTEQPSFDIFEKDHMVHVLIKIKTT